MELLHRGPFGTALCRKKRALVSFRTVFRCNMGVQGGREEGHVVVHFQITCNWFVGRARRCEPWHPPALLCVRSPLSRFAERYFVWKPTSRIVVVPMRSKQDPLSTIQPVDNNPSADQARPLSADSVPRQFGATTSLSAIVRPPFFFRIAFQIHRFVLPGRSISWRSLIPAPFERLSLERERLYHGDVHNANLVVCFCKVRRATSR